MKNTHKGMELCKIWLTEEEKKDLFVALKRHYPYRIFDIITEIYNRGDFN